MYVLGMAVMCACKSVCMLMPIDLCVWGGRGVMNGCASVIVWLFVCTLVAASVHVSYGIFQKGHCPLGMNSRVSV